MGFKLIRKSTGGGTAVNSFPTISTPAGTNPVASSGTDTLTFLADSSMTITGNSTNDSVQWKVATGGITNTHVSASAAVAYSKLSLTGSIVDADVSASAALALSKLATTGNFSTDGKITAGSATAGGAVLHAVTPATTVDHIRFYTSDGTYGGTASGSMGFVPYNAGSGNNEINMYSDYGQRINFYTKNGGTQRGRWMVDNTYGINIQLYAAAQLGLAITQGLAAGSSGRFIRLNDSNGSEISGFDNTGKLYFPLGTNSLPGLYPIGDTNTGIYSTGADTLDFSTGGTNRLEITSTGEVTIQTVGKGISIKTGTNARMGKSVLVAGTVIVSTTAVTANSHIFLTSNSSGGTIGDIDVTNITAGTSFTITSSSSLDTSTVAWIIFEPS